MAGRERGRKRRAECGNGEAADEVHHTIHNKQATTDYHQDYPFSPSFYHHSCGLKPATTTLGDESDDDSVEIIAEFQGPQQARAGVDRINSSSHCINISDEVDHHGYGFEYVKGQRVRTEYAPVLRDILEKYGDITRGNDVKSPHLLSVFLERICHIYQRLERGELVDTTRAKLQGIISQLRLFESHKVRVGWILERVENYLCISQTKRDYYDASSLEKDLQVYERQVCLLQQKISSIKAEIAIRKARNNNDQIKQAEAGDHMMMMMKGKARVVDNRPVHAGEGAGVRRSSRARKEPGWHREYFIPVFLISLGLMEH